MKQKEWTVYRIVFPNDKSYIGITCSFYKRKYAHKRDSKRKVHRPVCHAIQHFGWDAIRFEIIEEKIPTLELANESEKKYISKFDSHIDRNGYNATFGGDGCLGKKVSKERVAAFTEMSNKLWNDPEHIAKMRKVSDDRKKDYTKYVRAKMSESAKIKIARDGHTWQGRKHSQESKDKMSRTKALKRELRLNNQLPDLS